MRILHFEDDAIKHSKISNVLNTAGIRDINITWATSIAEGEKLLEEQDGAFDLILSDMQFPVQENGKIDEQAGKKLIALLKEKQIRIPIVIMSSLNYIIRDADRCIWYSDRNDWENELRAYVRNLQSQ